jgi:hypothetical protein
VKANDLVTKNFLALNSFSVTTETKAGDVSFKSTYGGDAKKPVAAVVEPKYEWKEQSLAFDGKLSSANAFTAKGTWKNPVDGLNVSLQGDRAVSWAGQKGEEAPTLKVTNSVTGGLQYNNQHVHWGLDVKFPVQSDGKISATTSLHGKLGDNADGGVKIDWEAGGSPKVEGKAVGGNDKMEGAVSWAYPSNTLGLNWWHSPCSHFQWAATAAWAIPKDSKEVPVINVAGNYKVDDNTTVKAKVSALVDRKDKDNGYRAGLSVQQKVNSNTTVTVGADVNLNHALNVGSGKKGTAVGDASTYGFQIAFK